MNNAATFVLLFLLLTGFQIRAEYIDAKGVRHLGTPPAGVETRQSQGGFVGIDRAATTKQLPKGEKAPDVYGGMPLRFIDGKMYDFSEAIAWANEKAYLEKTGVHYFKNPNPDHLTSIGGFVGADNSSGPLIADWDERFKKLGEFGKKYENWLVSGSVERVTPDALLLRNGNLLMFLKHHPQEKQLTDGEAVSVLALPVERKQYNALTLKCFDFGTSK